jgi:Zn-finger nucleic acid-binding protein
MPNHRPEAMKPARTRIPNQMPTCPRDRALLASNDVQGYRYLSCERCNGHWLPGRALARILSDLGLKVLHHATPPGQPVALPCPDCDGPLQGISVGDSQVDRCGRCGGVWLDAGEVAQLRRLFREGSAVVDSVDSTQRPANPAWTGVEAIDLVLNL